MNDHAKWPKHFCPNCGEPQKPFARYPWYFCTPCINLCEDFTGNKLVFYNVSLSGGLSWGYADEPAAIMIKNVAQVKCLISQRPVIVTEARFGGIVAQPTTSEYQPAGLAKKYFIDLSRQYNVKEMRERFETRS